MAGLSVSSLTPAELDGLARKVVDLGIETPAILYLEMTKPLSVVQGSFLTFLSPLVAGLFPGGGFQRLTTVLADRNQVEEFILRIEAEISRRAGKGHDKPSTDGTIHPQPPPADLS